MPDLEQTVIRRQTLLLQAASGKRVEGQAVAVQRHHRAGLRDAANRRPGFTRCKQEVTARIRVERQERGDRGTLELLILRLFRVSGGSFRLSWRDGGVQLTCHRRPAALSDARTVYTETQPVSAVRVLKAGRAEHGPWKWWKSRTNARFPHSHSHIIGIDPLRLPSP